MNTEKMDREKALTVIFAMYGKHRETEQIRAYLIAFSGLTDNELQYALRQAAEGLIGDPSFFPSAPQFVAIARKAPPPPGQYPALNDMPDVYERIPAQNKFRINRKAIEYYGKEKIEEWTARTITDEMLADTSDSNPLIAPLRPERLLPKPN